MQTLSNHEVWRNLRDIALAAYPTRARELRPFTVDVLAQESRTKHGDYMPSTGAIRIFNLSRATHEIIKTTVHELAHHVDVCFTGKTGHDLAFYGNYRHLLETAHDMRIVDLAKVGDDISVRDLDMMCKKVGAPDWQPHAIQPDSYLIKVDNAFAHKDALKAAGFRFSPTEKKWVREVTGGERAAAEAETRQVAPGAEVTVVNTADNTIDSVYFAVMGKDLWGMNDRLREAGFSFHKTRGWFRRIAASDKDRVGRECLEAFGTSPKFMGTL